MDADDPSQNENLSAAQLAALEALLRGETAAVAAAAAGVHRGSVHNWLRNDFAFQAQFNRERRDLQEQMTARLMRLAEKATAGVEHHLDDPDAAICMKVLTGLGLLSGKLPPIGSDDPKELEHAKLRADDLRDVDRMLAELRTPLRVA